MSKPTFLQALLGKPSQKYMFPVERKEFHSTRVDMLRIAAEERERGKYYVDPVKEADGNLAVDQVELEEPEHSDSRSTGSTSSSEDVFYTPNTTPDASTMPLPSFLFSQRSSQASVSPPNDSSSSSSSSSDHTWATTTHATTPTPLSDHGSLEYVSPLRRHNNTKEQKAKASKDEDWAWIAPTLSQTSVKVVRRHSTKSDSSSGRRPPSLPKDIPLWVPEPDLAPPARSTSKSRRKTGNSGQSARSMTVLVEEDEAENIGITKSASLASQSQTSAPRRARMKSNSNTSSRTNSLRLPSQTDSNENQSHNSRPKLPRRRSRSLGEYDADSAIPYVFTPYTPPALSSNATPGYTSLVLPRAVGTNGIINKDTNTNIGRVDLTRTGLAQTTMATVEVVRGLGSDNPKHKSFGARIQNFFHFKSSASKDRAHSSPSVTGSDHGLGFTSYRQPPSHVPADGVLIQVWAVGLDGVDARIVSSGEQSLIPLPDVYDKKESKKNSHGRHQSSQESSYGLKRSATVKSTKSLGSRSLGSDSRSTKPPAVGFIPGRGIVGRVVEFGWQVEEDVVRKSDWVIALIELPQCGALAEFVVVDRHRVYRVPHPRLKEDISTPSEPSSRINSPPPSSRSHSHSSEHSSSSGSRPSILPRSSKKPTRSPKKPTYSPLSLEELALLPTCGVSAYRAVQTFLYAFAHLMDDHGGNEHTNTARTILVLNGHDGPGAMAVQMLVKRGWRVYVHAPKPVLPIGENVTTVQEEEDIISNDMKQLQKRVVGSWGAERVLFDDGGDGDDEVDMSSRVVRLIQDLAAQPNSKFDGILDTIGGKDIWEASEVLLLKPNSNNNEPRFAQFTTLVGDTPHRVIPTARDNFRAGLRSLKEDLGKGKNKSKVGYAWINVSADVDRQGQDVRDCLEIIIRMAVNEGIRPMIAAEQASVFSFEHSPDAFDNRRLRSGATAVVRVVG